MKVQVVSQTSQRFKVCDLEKNPEMLAFNGSAAQKTILAFILKNCEKSALKHSLEQPILLDFKNLSTILVLCVSKETHFQF